MSVAARNDCMYDNTMKINKMDQDSRIKINKYKLRPGGPGRVLQYHLLHMRQKNTICNSKGDWILLYSASSYSCHLKSRSRTHFFPLVAINENNWDKKYIDRFRVYYILRLFEKITLYFQFPKISVIRGLLVYIIK